MDFTDYISLLKKSFKLTKVNENTYMLHKNKKTLEITPDKMYSNDEIEETLNTKYPNIGDNYKDNSVFDNIKDDSVFDNIKDNSVFGNIKDNSVFGNIGRDDLHPAIGKRKGRPHGSIFTPEDLKEQEESKIERSDIFPLKKKTDPDDDHFKKPGSDDSNPFLY